MLNWKRMVTAVNQAEAAVNKLRPADAYMRQRTGWTLVQVMAACRRTGDIQLSEQMVMNLMFLYGRPNLGFQPFVYAIADMINT